MKLGSTRHSFITRLIILFVLFFAATFGPMSCMRAVYVPDGTPVRLREDVENVKVWVLGEDGKPVATKMNLPEGWFCLPMPEGEKLVKS